MGRKLSLKGKVVVITGASSGLGRAAALEFARRGSHLVLAARRSQALDAAVEECRSLGARAVALTVDVRNEAEVVALAKLALAQTGSIDVWVNNAGVTCFAPLDTDRFDEHREVLETNLFGAIYGVRAVLPAFRRQRHGTLINVGSVLSKIGQPFVPSYVISKFGLHGLTETLRAAVAELPDVHVCSLLPYAMDTEHFEHGANAFERPAFPMSPIQSPEKAARALVELAERPRRQRLVPRIAALGLAIHFLAPESTERVVTDLLLKWHFGPAHQALTTGNVHAPTTELGAVHGTRGARVGTGIVVLYAAGRFVQLQFLHAAHRLRALWGTRARA
ncbi:MAG TPA: SDR family NAD(P)-dependent oxidoreductase [Polyangiaceae bacterium]|nr:SDR family NAD(P)-dependent oxidoreductase [Polyangiaceae bacterium]